MRYNKWGYFAQIQRGPLVLWQAQQKDAQQQVTQAMLGNGLLVARNYDLNADTKRNMPPASASLYGLSRGAALRMERSVSAIG